MRSFFNPGRLLSRLAVSFALAFSLNLSADATIEERFRALVETADGGPYHAPISIRSSEQKELVSAEVDAVLPYPFADVAAVTSSPSQFCDFISLVIFIKSCTYSAIEAPAVLTWYMGRKNYEDPDPDNALAFKFTLESAGTDHLAARLYVPEGLLGVKENRVEFELWSVEGRTLVHVHASYVSSMQSRLAMGTYLMTMGRNKIGFSMVTDADGKQAPVKGALGIIERNAMRYFLALESYLEVSNSDPEKREQKLLERWFDATEKYHDQLFEVPREEYLANKERERKNQLQLQREITLKN